jgi:hypothetical protein
VRGNRETRQSDRSDGHFKVRRMMAKNRQDTIVETQQIVVTMGLVSGHGQERPGFGATKEKQFSTVVNICKPRIVYR